MAGKSSSSLGRVVLLIAGIIATLFVLRFVMSIAWTVLKWGALGGLAVVVVYLFMSSSGTEKVENKDKPKLPRG